MKVTIIDQDGPSANVTVPVEKVSTVLNGWFTDAPLPIALAIKSLQAALLNGEEGTQEIEMYLGIRILR